MIHSCYHILDIFHMLNDNKWNTYKKVMLLMPERLVLTYNMRHNVATYWGKFLWVHLIHMVKEWIFWCLEIIFYEYFHLFEKFLNYFFKKKKVNNHCYLMIEYFQSKWNNFWIKEQISRDNFWDRCTIFNRG